MSSFTLTNQICMIVEPSGAFATTIQSSLNSQGFPSLKVIIVKKFDEALKEIQRLKPCLLICEYEIDNRPGLDLIMAQHKVVEDSARISMIVTKNSSDSVVAEAAEEQVDAFLLKPFSPNEFIQKLLATIEKKTNPSNYSKLIADAKVLTAQQKFDEALNLLEQAKALNDKPSLAYYYAGEVKKRQNLPLEALAEFEAGRKFQNLHYKCVIAQFDTFILLKKYPEAQELSSLIILNFPISPRLLASMFLATTLTKQTEILNKLFDQFLKVDQRTEKLVAIAALAYLIAGTTSLSKSDVMNAMQFFEKNLIISQRSFSNIETIVGNLIKLKYFNEAETILMKTNIEDRQVARFKQLSFMIDQVKLPGHKLVEAGRKLIKDGDATPEIYEAVLHILVKDKKMTLAESIVIQAVSQFPAMRKHFNAMLESKN